MGQALLFDVIIKPKQGESISLIKKCDLYYCTALREFLKDELRHDSHFNFYDFNYDEIPDSTELRLTLNEREYDMILNQLKTCKKSTVKKIKTKKEEGTQKDDHDLQREIDELKYFYHELDASEDCLRGIQHIESFLLNQQPLSVTPFDSEYVFYWENN